MKLAITRFLKLVIENIPQRPVVLLERGSGDQYVVMSLYAFVLVIACHIKKLPRVGISCQLMQYLPMFSDNCNLIAVNLGFKNRLIWFAYLKRSHSAAELFSFGWMGLGIGYRSVIFLYFQALKAQIVRLHFPGFSV
jgi:hypothetical protein